LEKSVKVKPLKSSTVQALPGGLGTAGSAMATLADPTLKPGAVAAWATGTAHVMTNPNHPAHRPLRTASLVIAI
jgi:hypothetical protein